MAERGKIFKESDIITPDKSWFDMSFDFLLSMNFGEIVPTTCMECMPEDKIEAKSDSFVRLSPLVAPTFGKCNMFSYHFYVRNRSIWTQWESFITDKDQKKSWQQANPLWTSPEMPYIDVRKVLYNGLFLTNTIGNVKLQVDANIGDLTPFIFSGLSNVSYLVIRYEENSNGFITDIKTCIQETVAGYFDDSSNGNVHTCFVIPFVRNKADNFNSYSLGKFYNPFSNGTLFDYLGVDITGILSGNTKFFNDCVAAIVPNIAVLNQSWVTMYNVEYWPVSQDWTVQSGQSVAQFPVSLNVADFINTHAILGVGCYSSDNADTYKAFFINSIGQSVYQKRSDGSFVVTNDVVSPLYFQNDSSRLSSLSLRAYWSIYIDYFRDENYINVNPCVDFSRDGEDIDWTQSKSDIFDYLTLQFKAWEHDPYTTALPQAQKGSPVRFLPDANLKFGASVSTANTNLKSGSLYSYANDNGDYPVATLALPSSSSSASQIFPINVDLSASTIENLRFASALQTLREKEARGGSRYFELMEAIFGAYVDDAKIDRPVFLGGDKTPIQVSEVLQTSATQVTDDQPLGQMAGRAVSIGNDDKVEYITPDHGFFIELCCVLPRTNYQQGVLPMFRRHVRLDYAFPDFAQLGEQQVPQSELWYSAIDSEDDRPLGFQSRYYDMKYNRDRTSGTFKDTLSHWTWSRIFDSVPVIGKKFIEVHPDYRQFAVTDESQEHVYVHMWHDIQVQRALPVFGTPTLK